MLTESKQRQSTETRIQRTERDSRNDHSEWPDSHDEKIQDLIMLQRLAQIIAVLFIVSVGFLVWYLVW